MSSFTNESLTLHPCYSINTSHGVEGASRPYGGHDMRKMMPMILVTLFLTSFLAGIQWTELEDTQNDSAGARAGADPAVMDLTSPRATSVDSTTGEVRNTLKAGDEVTFDAYIKNLGDAAIEDMQITVEIKLAESGVAGNTAVDSAGNTLSWTNSDVICNDTQTCPYDTLAAGSLLANGKYRMQYGGEDLVWTPEIGDYYVEISVSTNGDNDDLENDMVSRFVSVTNWYDIEVDLSWDDGNEINTGSGEAFFTLTVTTDGSTEWDARNVAINLKATGSLTTAQGSGGEDLLANEGVMVTAGTAGDVTVFFNSTAFAEGMAANHTGTPPTQVNDTSNNNPCTPKVVPCNMTRSIVSSGTEWTWSGSVVPDTSGSGSESYEIEAIMVSYDRYGQLPECVESSISTGEGNGSEGEVETYNNECEVSTQQDDNSGTNEDSIIGAINNFHDVAVTTVNIGQGFAQMGDEARYLRTQGDTLDVGASVVQAIVEHKGSSGTELYDWNVTFTITAPDGEVTTTQANQCTGQGMQPDYVYAQLGESATTSAFGYACTAYDFGPGEHTISAEIVMSGAHTDQNSGNDEISFEIDAENNAPYIESLVVENVEILVVGSGALLSMDADAFDADDPEGMALNYTWTRQSGEELPCTDVGELGSFCQVPIDPSWVPNDRITLKVTDVYGESDAKTVDVDVWNHVSTSESTASGITVEYTITYADANDFSFTLADATEGFQQQVLEDIDGPKYVGSYDSVAVVDYDPSLNLDDNEVDSQSLTVTYPSTLGATSLWYTVGGDWELLSDTVTTVDSDTDSFVVDVSSVTTGGSIRNGKLAMFGGALEMPDKPAAKATDLAMIATKGGDLSISWSVEGTLVPDDGFKLTVCETNDATACVLDTLVAQSDRGASVSGDDTTHGTDYTATIQVYNSETKMYNDFIDTDNAVADSGVDGTFDVTDMTVSAADGKWTVVWKAEGAGSDVAKWKVCYQSAEFSANEMNQGTCTLHAGLSATVDQPTKSAAGTYPFYFSAAPMDGLGNIRLEGSAGHTKMVVTEDDVPVDPQDCDDDEKDVDGNCVIDDSSKSGSDDVPTWTWFVIIGIVLVAFLVGAFILSRGGEEGGEEGDKDWDY